MIIKKALLTLSVVAALVLSQATWADSRNHRRGYGNYGSAQYGYRNNRDHYQNSYRSNRRYNSYHRDRLYKNHFDISYGRHYSRRGHYDSGSFVGGLVLGSLFSYPRYSRHDHQTVVYRNVPATRTTREIVYVNKSQTTASAPIANGRRLLRDLEGNCFERIIDEQGNETRVQLDAEECNF